MPEMLLSTSGAALPLALAALCLLLAAEAVLHLPLSPFGPGAAASPRPSTPCSSTAAGPLGGDPNVTLLLVDVDAGADDAMALMELLAAEQLNDPALRPTKIVAISCVSGNAPIETVVRNVMAVLKAAGRSDVPVFLGSPVSLLHENPFAPLYGDDGFGDFLADGDTAGALAAAQREHAVPALSRLVRDNPGRLTLLAIGPLTNVALAQRMDPAFLAGLREVYVNGAVVHGGGNEGEPGKEINSNFDPEAAFVVYNSTRALINLMPSETVKALRVTKAWRRDVLGAVDTPQVQLLNKAERKVLEAPGDGWVNANGLLAATLLFAETVRERNTGKLLVSTSEGLARGATFVDFKGGSGPDNVLVLERPDSEAFQRLALRLLSVPPAGLRAT